MITQSKYKKALAIVEAYQKQIQHSAEEVCFSLEDLQTLSGTIQIPKLTKKIVGEDYAAWLEDQLELKGLRTLWVSLDYLGFISISFSDRTVTDEKMDIVLGIINSEKTQ